MMLPYINEFHKHKVLYYRDGKKISKKEVKEYHAWADKLMRFIDLAIEKESGIIWSV